MKRNVLFNDTLNTFAIIWHWIIGHVVNGHSDNERKPATATSLATLSD